MVMITFNLIVFFNVKVSLFFNFFDPFVYFFWILVVNLFFIIFHFFCLLFSFFIFFAEGAWVIFLVMILARESVFRLGYFSGFFVFVVIALTIMLYCIFRRISLLSFYIFF